MDRNTSDCHLPSRLSRTCCSETLENLRAPESPAFGKVRRPKTDAALWFSVTYPSGKFMQPENRALFRGLFVKSAYR